MPISYTQLSTYNLLQNNEIYNRTNEICNELFSDWSIENFERLLLGEKIQLSFSEDDVRNAINDTLLGLDKTKPFLRYLEQGKHYGYELFTNIPEPSHYETSFMKFWLYISRAFSEYVLPIDEKQFRTFYLDATEKLGIRLSNNRDYSIDRLVVNNGYGNDGFINAKDIREAMYVVEARNRAFHKRMTYNCEQSLLDVPKRILNERADNYDNPYWKMKLKDDFDIHSLCFAVDSSCTVRQRNVAFLKWGVFTGTPLKYIECGRKLGISGNCVRQFENAVIRNSIRDKSMLFDFEPKE